MLRPIATLAMIAFVAAAVLAAVNLATRDRIELEQRRHALATLSQLLPEDAYDNEMVNDRINAWIPGLDPPSTLYRARKQGRPVALLAEITTPDGYSGPISLLVGLRPDGEIIGVRVLGHRETPGLGDRIEHRRSDWIGQFSGTSPHRPPAEQWRSTRRGGEFDTLSSATITSEAVIGAVRRLLDWYQDNREQAFDMPTQ